MNSIFANSWLDGNIYPTEADKSRFGRVANIFNGWGELRKQKKPPHTQVLYVWSFKTLDPMAPKVLVLRSINNCSSDQLREAIQLAGLRLEQHQISQTEAEFLLDKCYAELQRRLDWKDSEKGKRNARQSEKHKENPRVEGSY